MVSDPRPQHSTWSLNLALLTAETSPSRPMKKKVFTLPLVNVPLLQKKSDYSYEQQAEPFTKTQYAKDT